MGGKKEQNLVFGTNLHLEGTNMVDAVHQTETITFTMCYVVDCGLDFGACKCFGLKR